MNINHLTSKDWVNIKQTFSEKLEIGQVTFADDIHYGNHALIVINNHIMDPSQIFPLPTTPEILLANNFKYDGKGSYTLSKEMIGLRGKSSRFDIVFDGHTSENGWMLCVQLIGEPMKEYGGRRESKTFTHYMLGDDMGTVDELQHALRDCGLTGLADSIIVPEPKDEVKIDIFANAKFGDVFVTDEKNENGKCLDALFLGEDKERRIFKFILEGYSDVDWFDEKGHIVKISGCVNTKNISVIGRKEQ